jgi:hypothetical protein
VLLEVKGLEAKIVATGQQILKGVDLIVREVWEGRAEPSSGRASTGPNLSRA